MRRLLLPLLLVPAALLSLRVLDAQVPGGGAPAPRPNVVVPGGWRQTTLCQSRAWPSRSATWATRYPLSIHTPSFLMSVWKKMLTPSGGQALRTRSAAS